MGNSTSSSRESKDSRRSILKVLGMSVIAGFSASAGAQTIDLDKITTRRLDFKSLPKNFQINPKLLEVQLSDPRAMKALDLTDRLPMDTPINKMGLRPKYAELLTGPARKLRKVDLETLAKGKNTELTSRLTVEDIRSVQVAFGGGLDVSASALDVSCCCCTPCCCAAASTVSKAA